MENPTDDSQDAMEVPVSKLLHQPRDKDPDLFGMALSLGIYTSKLALEQRPQLYGLARPRTERPLENVPVLNARIESRAHLKSLIARARDQELQFAFELCLSGQLASRHPFIRERIERCLEMLSPWSPKNPTEQESPQQDSRGDLLLLVSFELPLEEGRVAFCIAGRNFSNQGCVYYSVLESPVDSAL